MINLTKKLLISGTLIAILTTISKPLKAETIIIGQNSQDNVITVNGVSGGTNHDSRCGYVNNTPNQLIKLADNPSFMSVTLAVNSAEASPTLLVIGLDNDTQFCAFQDQATRENPSISGLWASGTYAIYVGDRQGGNYSFTLTINSSNNLIQ